MFATERKLPLSGGAEKRRYVRDMFSAVAPTYDLINRTISFTLDRRWRRRAVDRLEWERVPAGRYLDLCAGTLDLAAELANRRGFGGIVFGADFSRPMLQRGRGKAGRVRPLVADALELPFRDASFDGATVGWGVRNLADLDQGLREAARVLRPGARLVILESSTPPRQPIRGFYLFYFRHVLPRVGRLLSRHETAYSWLPASVAVFDSPEQLAQRMERAGFSEVRFERLLGGVCTIHVGVKAGPPRPEVPRAGA
jgi:demethylmenaquinone methyltransferase/2-methoxy-6-polyprenyl-1,4-benzoquinol methylase